jgi:hypothetical protein
MRAGTVSGGRVGSKRSKAPVRVRCGDDDESMVVGPKGVRGTGGADGS